MSKVFLIVLTIWLSSGCTHTKVKFDILERPVLPVATWHIVTGETEENRLYCTTQRGAGNLLERELIRDAYEASLKIIIKGCNKALH